MSILIFCSLIDNDFFQLLNIYVTYTCDIVFQSVSEKCFTQDVRHNLWGILGMIFQTHSKAAAEEDE